MTASQDAPPRDFAEYLIRSGYITEEQAEELRAASEKEAVPFDRLLVDRNVLSEEGVLKHRSDFLQTPIFSLGPGEKIPEEILKLISEDAARRYKFVPIRRTDDLLEVGMAAPEDVLAQDALRFLLSRMGLRVKILLISQTTLQEILGQYRPFQGEVQAALTELDQMLSEAVSAETKAQTEKEKAQLTEEAPIIKVVAVVIRQAMEGRASDIHIEPGPANMRIRFRVDGILYTSLFLPMSAHGSIIARIKILAQLKLDETRLAQDGRFRSMVDGKPIDFRVSTFPTAFGEKIAIRLLDPSVGLRSLPELGLSGQASHYLQEAIARPFGMVLITGPTGSGKSTTLYALLKTISRDEVNVVTLEDPVEYFMEGVNQSQINEPIGYTFAEGLRHILRGDPNIIMVGEIRDGETANLAVNAALTGHLVLSTLHTNDAVGIIPRLIDLGVNAFLISPTLLGGVSQRLVRKLCDDCKKPRPLFPKERDFVHQVIESMPEKERGDTPDEKDWKFWEAPGCALCGHSGTKGRIAVFEVLRMTRELEAIILDAPSEGRIREEAKRQGMVTMLQDGILKTLEGSITLEHLLRVVEEQEDLA